MGAEPQLLFLHLLFLHRWEAAPPRSPHCLVTAPRSARRDREPLAGALRGRAKTNPPPAAALPVCRVHPGAAPGPDQPGRAPSPRGGGQRLQPPTRRHRLLPRAAPAGSGCRQRDGPWRGPRYNRGTDLRATHAPEQPLPHVAADPRQRHLGGVRPASPTGCREKAWAGAGATAPDPAAMAGPPPEGSTNAAPPAPPPAAAPGAARLRPTPRWRGRARALSLPERAPGPGNASSRLLHRFPRPPPRAAARTAPRAALPHSPGPAQRSAPCARPPRHPRQHPPRRYPVPPRSGPVPATAGSGTPTAGSRSPPRPGSRLPHGRIPQHGLRRSPAVREGPRAAAGAGPRGEALPWAGWGRGCGSRPARLLSMAWRGGAEGWPSRAEPRRPAPPGPAGEDALRSPPRPRLRIPPGTAGPSWGERAGRGCSARACLSPAPNASSSSRVLVILPQPGWDPTPITPASGLPCCPSLPCPASPSLACQPLLTHILGLAPTLPSPHISRCFGHLRGAGPAADTP